MNVGEPVRPAPYPQQCEVFGDLDAVIRDYVLHGYPADDTLADPRAVVVTQGSCFARNLAASLSRLGARVAHLNVNEYINTTIANAMFFEHIFKGAECDPVIRTIFSQLVDEARVAEFRELVSTCRAFVLTIGVAPCWFVKGTEQLVLQPDKRRLGDFEMRTTSPSWNAGNIRRIIDSIRQANRDARIFLTLSPAPLNYSFEFPSTIVGDCLSKSVLRVAIHEVMADKREGVRYWPSFEVVRWVGSHLGPVFGAEDNHPRHVSNFIVDAIVRNFIRIHGGSESAVEGGAAAALDNDGPFTLSRNF
jgi:GSCFA family